MESMIFCNKHYITVDEQNRITNGFSNAFRQPSETDICINEHGMRQFRIFPDVEENPALYEWDHMIPLYKYENGEVVRRTQEEIDEDIAALPPIVVPPTTDERISSIEDALCEMDAANAASIAALEDALCEMDMGGNDDE